MHERLNKERICTGTVLIFLRRLTRVTRSTNSFQCKIVYGRCKFNQTHARRILLSFHQEVFSAVYPRGFPLSRDFSSFHLACRPLFVRRLRCNQELRANFSAYVRCVNEKSGKTLTVIFRCSRARAIMLLNILNAICRNERVSNKNVAMHLLAA